MQEEEEDDDAMPIPSATIYLSNLPNCPMCPPIPNLWFPLIPNNIKSYLKFGDDEVEEVALDTMIFKRKMNGHGDEVTSKPLTCSRPVEMQTGIRFSDSLKVPTRK